MVQRYIPTGSKATARPTKKTASSVGPIDADTRAVIRALEEIDAARADIRWYQDDVWAACTRSFRVSRAVKAFREQGGVTADDFRAFLRGEALRGCKKAKRHLRMIVDNAATCRRRRLEDAHVGPSAA